MRLTILTVVVSAFFISQAFADVKQIKIYKEAFPGEAPKCILCHTDKLPKKDDGKHDLNDYGKKVVAENSEPTAETYLKIGKAEDYKAENAESVDQSEDSTEASDEKNETDASDKTNEAQKEEIK